MKRLVLILSLLTVTLTAIAQTTKQLSKQDKEKITKEVNRKYLLYSKLYQKYSDLYEEFPTHENYMLYRKYLYLYKKATSAELIVSSANLSDASNIKRRKDSVIEANNQIQRIKEQDSINLIRKRTYLLQKKYQDSITEVAKNEINKRDYLESISDDFIEHNNTRDPKIKIKYRKLIDSISKRWDDSVRRVKE